MAIQNDFVVDNRTYTRISSPVTEGRFLDVNTSVNTPHILTVRPKVTRDGVCQYVIQVSTAKDALVPGQKDDMMSAQFSWRFDPRRFSYEEASAHLGLLANFYNLPGMTQKIFTGQV